MEVRKIYPVIGMSCAGCAVSVESMLKSQQGVTDAGVNLSSSTVWVNFDTKITTPEKLRDSVRAIGYDLVIEEKNSNENILLLRYQQVLKWRFILSLLLSVPLMVVSMWLMDHPYTPWLSFILSTPVVFIFGIGFHKNALKQARHFRANMDTLISLSTTVAYFYSTFTLFFPEYWSGRGATPHLYFESAAMIITFVLMGKWLEEKAKGETASAIKKIMGLQPQTVWLKKSDALTQVPLGVVKKGDLIVVKPGERIPVDGIVTEGQSWIDENTITGEPLPVEKVPGQNVWAGTANLNGVITIEAEQIGSESVLGRILETVKNAQNSKTPVQRIADRVSGIFVPIILVLSVATFAAWYAFAPELAMSHGLIAAITVLVIACPCALGLATPTAVMAGIGRAARKNILIRNAESIELMLRVDTFVLDKTGTLTEGRPEVEGIQWFDTNPFYPQMLKKIEELSNHPMAKSVVHYLKDTDSPNFSFESIEELPGKGMLVKFNNKTYRVGNQTFLEGIGNWKQIDDPGRFSVGFAEDNRLVAKISITDKLKESAQKTVTELKRRGYNILLLSGDKREAVREVAEKLGIDSYAGGLLPSDKLKYIAELKEKGSVVAMVGDGINDTEALSHADVSIAMGKGSDIAIDAAQVTILKSDLSSIIDLTEIAKATVRTIKQNLFWAFIYNLIAIPVAAGILYPFFGIQIDPMVAALAMALSSVSVVTNSVLLHLKRKN